MSTFQLPRNPAKGLDLNSDFGRDTRAFALRQFKLGSTFDASRATSKDHASALNKFADLYAAVSRDGGLSQQDRSELHTMSQGVREASVDAYADNLTAASWDSMGVTGTAYDPGHFDASDVRLADRTLRAAEHRTGTPHASQTPDHSHSGSAHTHSHNQQSASSAAATPGRTLTGTYAAEPSAASVRQGTASYGEGHKGPMVGDLQRALQAQGFYPKGTSGNVDTMYGPATQAAVKRWQAANNMEPNGTINAESLKLLTGQPSAPAAGVAAADAMAAAAAAATAASLPQPGATAADAMAAAAAGIAAGAANGTTANGAAANGASQSKSGPWIPAAVSPAYKGPDDGLGVFDISVEAFEGKKEDVFFGGTKGKDIANTQGRTLLKGATNVGVGAEYKTTVLGVTGRIGDSQEAGVQGRVGVNGDAYAGAGASGKWEDDSKGFHRKIGLYAATEVEGEVSFGARYFGVGAKASVGLGGGLQAEDHATYEDGRLSLGAALKGGWGGVAGLGADVWIDFGQMKEDLGAAGDMVSDAFSSIGDSAGSFFDGLDFSRQ